MRFADPLLLLFLILPLGAVLYTWLRRRRTPARYIGFPPFSLLASEPPSPRVRWRRLPGALRVMGLVLLIVAWARPQLPHDVREIRLRSRNIMVALDISSSMKSRD